jgi:hypothetical protein
MHDNIGREGIRKKILMPRYAEGHKGKLILRVPVDHIEFQINNGIRTFCEPGKGISSMTLVHADGSIIVSVKIYRKDMPYLKSDWECSMT